MEQSEDPSPEEIAQRAAAIREGWTQEQRLARAYVTLGSAFGDGRRVEQAARWHWEMRRQAKRAEGQE